MTAVTGLSVWPGSAVVVLAAALATVTLRELSSGMGSRLTGAAPRAAALAFSASAGGCLTAVRSSTSQPL